MNLRSQGSRDITIVRGYEFAAGCLAVLRTLLYAIPEGVGGRKIGRRKIENCDTSERIIMGHDIVTFKTLYTSDPFEISRIQRLQKTIPTTFFAFTPQPRVYVPF